jgi:hypothetical protein
MISSAIVKNSIINNCDCKILLDQSKYQNKFGQVQELLGFSDKQTEQVLSINKANDPFEKYKEAYFSTHNKVYRIQVSPEENLCYTTEQTEKLKVMNAAKRYGSMERGIRSLLMVVCFVFVSFSSHSQIPIIGTIIAKVVKAIDLKIQKLQNQTMFLQNAQKEMENKLHALKLDEIKSWSDKQKALYQNYFDELQTVKTSITKFEQVKDVVGKQVAIVNEYNNAKRVLNKGSFLSPAELGQVSETWVSILQRSLDNLSQLQFVSGKSSQMNDAGRLSIINKASDSMDSCLAEIRQFNRTVLLLNQQRAQERENIQKMKRLIQIP